LFIGLLGWKPDDANAVLAMVFPRFTSPAALAGERALATQAGGEDNGRGVPFSMKPRVTTT
jgi:hypothetical protein